MSIAEPEDRRKGYLKERPSPTTLPPADPKMAQAQRWTVWTLRKAEAGKKPSKVPVAKPTDDTTWNYYHAARACLSDPKIAGLGFEMFGRPGVVGIDIDNCIDPSGNRSELASKFLLMLEAAGGKFHVEISPSGKGLRAFAAETSLPFHDFTNTATGVEVYTGESGRFLAFTGKMIPGFGTGPFDPLPPGAVKFLAEHALKMKDGITRAEMVEVGDRPELGQREDWAKLHKGAQNRLAREHKVFMAEGTLGKKYASASEQLFALELSLLKHLKPPEVYQLLISAPGTWGVALEHREGVAEKALSFIWNDIHRALAGHEELEKERENEESGWKACDIEVEITEHGAKAKFIQLNLTNAFEKHNEWVDRLGWNLFDGRATLDRKDITVRQIHELSAWAVGFLRWPYEWPRNAFEESVQEAAKLRPWNPVEEELRSIIWDGKDRLEAFTDAVILNPTELDYQITRKWLIGFVARGVKPGCKMDTMLCLRGPEGAYKTTFARIMAGDSERFTDTPTFETDQNSSMARGGMRIIEVGEGAAARRADRFALKNDLSKTFEHFRPPYGRNMERRERGFCYILTSNPQEFLRSDQDGLRRFWPVDALPKIDIKWLEENRDQVLAQALVSYDQGEQWWWDTWNTPPELIERVGGAVIEDPLEGAINAVVADPENHKAMYVTLAMITLQIEGKIGKNLDRSSVQRIIDLLHRFGMISTQRRIDGVKARWWFHPKWLELPENAKKMAKMIPFPMSRPSLEVPTVGGAELLE